ncbi:MAG: patatin-like phospholipase family protein [Gammaproteobacteria bacterium]
MKALYNLAGNARDPISSRAAIVLPGGGARGAYQAGVLSGIAELFDPDVPVPFPIIAGTSAGAMNAAYLATQMQNFRATTSRLGELWSNLSVGEVYRAEYRKIFGVVLRWLWSFISGGRGDGNSRALLDNSPLRELLAANLDFPAIQRHIDAGLLRGLAVTIAGYTSERSLTYFQAARGIEPWWRERREGRPAEMTLDHIMASLALPIVFPAVKLGKEWCGDGSTRQLAPLSSPIHLGADRILVIDTHHHRPSSSIFDARAATYPSLSRIGGYLLDTIFSDSLSADLERAERINRVLEHISPAMIEPEIPQVRSVETLVIAPSRGPGKIAARHIAALPKGVRWMLRSLGGEEEGGDVLLSYLLFQDVYCQELIELGRRDALARTDDLRRFFDLRRTVVVPTEASPVNVSNESAS